MYKDKLEHSFVVTNLCLFISQVILFTLSRSQRCQLCNPPH